MVTPNGVRATWPVGSRLVPGGVVRTVCIASRPVLAASGAEGDTGGGDACGESTKLNSVATCLANAIAPAIGVRNEVRSEVKVHHEKLHLNNLKDVTRTQTDAADSTPDVYAAEEPHVTALMSDDLLQDPSEDFSDVNEFFAPTTVAHSTVDETGIVPSGVLVGTRVHFAQRYKNSA